MIRSIALLLLAGAAMPAGAAKYMLPSPEPPRASYKLIALVEAAAAQAGYSAGDIDRLKLMIDAESAWNPRAEHPVTRATGLCQVLAATARGEAGWRGTDDEIRERLRNPYLHIPLCVRLFTRRLHAYCGDWSAALAAWNAGPEPANLIARVMGSCLPDKGLRVVRAKG
jgi:soluble lytic murein transglycosylase-like protein